MDNLTPETAKRLSERLSIEGLRTQAFFRDLSPDQFRLIVYDQSPCWSVREVLAHFVSAEKAFGKLIDDILAGGSGAPVDFDIDQFNEKDVSQFAALEVNLLMEQFEKLRLDNSRRVAAMSAADLGRAGRHPFLGVAVLEEIVKLLYRHNQIHQRDIRRKISTA